MNELAKYLQKKFYLFLVLILAHLNAADSGLTTLCKHICKRFLVALGLSQLQDGLGKSDPNHQTGN